MLRNYKKKYLFRSYKKKYPLKKRHVLLKANLILAITGTLNNTFFNLTNLAGETIYNTSCGVGDFIGTRKASKFAIRDIGRKFIK